MKALFTVGEIARLHKLQKQTLIFYDKEGVFKPNIIDKNNGYRYYTADQMEVLDSILMLRNIGIPLKKIKSFLEKRAPTEAANLLSEQRKQVCMQAKHLNEIAQKLQRKIETLNSIDKNKADQIISTEKDEYFAVEKIEAPNTLLQTDIATKKLLTRAYSHNYPFYYQVGVVVPLQSILDGKYEAAEYACLPLNKKTSHNDIYIKPAGLYATGSHKGDYSDIGNAYKRILSFIEANGFTAMRQAFEYCISDSLTAKSTSEYITEINIPVELSK